MKISDELLLEIAELCVFEPFDENTAMHAYMKLQEKADAGNNSGDNVNNNDNDTNNNNDINFDVADIADAYSIYINRVMKSDFLKHKGEMRTNEKIVFMIMKRFELMSSHKEFVKKLMIFFSKPQHWSKMLSILSRTVDEIWYLAGDRSTDFNFYTKRILLATIYIPTLCYWLRDETDDFVATKKFLLRRIGEVMKFGKLKAKMMSLFKITPPNFDMPK